MSKPSPTHEGSADGADGLALEPTNDSEGCKPPPFSHEERAHFREIDADMASGQVHLDLLLDVQWVYDHLDDDDVTAMDAPNRGAWPTIFMARHNQEVHGFDMAGGDEGAGEAWGGVEKPGAERAGECTKRGDSAGDSDSGGRRKQTAGGGEFG